MGTVIGAIAAELRKLLSLPATALAAAICVLGTAGVATLNANSLRRGLDTGSSRLADVSTFDVGFDATIVGSVGTIVLGVVIISSEYTATRDDAAGGRQVIVSLAAVPRRGLLLAAKALVLAVTVAALGAVAVPSSLLLSQALLGRHGHAPGEVMAALGWRPVGVVVYWVLTSLVAAAIAALTRNGIVPMLVLITNGTVVSVSFLLTRVTDLAAYLPDLAGARMFTDYPGPHVADPVAGGLVMAAWAMGLLGLAGYVLQRRDA